eukprot:3623660-Rhodomonas_salina.4
MQVLASAQQALAGVLQSPTLSALLAGFQDAVWERHCFAEAREERGAQERAFEERAQAIISAVDGASACIRALRSVQDARFSISHHLQDLQHAVICEAAVVFSTTSMAPLMPMSRATLHCVSVLVDEAGQVPVADLAAVADGTWQRLILAGDDKQLPAVVTGDGCEKAGFGRSLLERLRTNPAMADMVLMLDTQFRMDPIIAAFSSQEFYDNRLRHAVATPNPLPHSSTKGSSESTANKFLGGIVICDTSGLPASADEALDFGSQYPRNEARKPLLSAEYKPQGSASFANDLEAFLIKQSLEQFEKTTAG